MRVTTNRAHYSEGFENDSKPVAWDLHLWAVHSPELIYEDIKLRNNLLRRCKRQT